MILDLDSLNYYKPKSCIQFDVPHFTFECYEQLRLLKFLFFYWLWSVINYIYLLYWFDSLNLALLSKSISTTPTESSCRAEGGVSVRVRSVWVSALDTGYSGYSQHTGCHRALLSLHHPSSLCLLQTTQLFMFKFYQHWMFSIHMIWKWCLTGKYSGYESESTLSETGLKINKIIVVNIRGKSNRQWAASQPNKYSRQKKVWFFCSNTRTI